MEPRNGAAKCSRQIKTRAIVKQSHKRKQRNNVAKGNGEKKQ